MDKIPFIPPEIPKLSKEEIKSLKTYEINDEKKAYIYEKYEKPLKEREERLKKKKRSDWWRNNAINVATLVIAILTLIATIILGVLALLY